jgi:hypothetical protein
MNYRRLGKSGLKKNVEIMDCIFPGFEEDKNYRP